jgi:hypothetical protein
MDARDRAGPDRSSIRIIDEAKICSTVEHLLGFE